MCDAPSLDKNMRIKTLSRASLERMSDKEKEQWKNAISWFFLTDSIKRKIRLEIQSKPKIIDITTILLAGIGLLTNALKPTYDTRTIQVNGESKRYIELIRFITTITTIASISHNYALCHSEVSSYIQTSS